MQYRSSLIVACILLFTSFQLSAQTRSMEEMDITGLWKGYMYNDTTRLNYRYEIAISEKNGKLYGFTHTYFIKDDKEFHGVKRIKIKKGVNEITTEDVELIVNNFPVKPPKGVHVTNTLVFEIKDTVMTLSGKFSTNRTKEYSPVTGFVLVERKNDFKNSALIPHLQELGLAQELSFADEIKKSETRTETRSAIPVAQPVVQTTPPVTEKPVTEQPVTKTNTPVVKEKEQPVVRSNQVTKPAEEKPVAKTTTPVRPAPVEKEKQVSTQPVAKTTAPVVKEKDQPVVKPNPVTKPVEEKPVVTAVPSAVDFEKRTIETIQAVYYKSDSLVLTLYDNGEVDGDTVSVLMNGKLIMPRVGLSTNAVRKTIYTQDVGDSIQLVMYAETLGTLPPNTGLLIVNDGNDRYEIRFSGDMERSSAIVFRRKKN